MAHLHSLVAAAGLHLSASAALGAVDQLCSVREMTQSEGSAQGSRTLVVRNPGGFSLDVLLDRAMDIGWADACGAPLAWCSPVGATSSTRFPSGDRAWASAFCGGLLTTCGLRATGMPSVDAEGREHPLHGRVSAIPAANVTTALEEDGRGGVRLVITGDMTEWGLGEEALVLHRRLAITVSQPLLEVHDVVVNAGARAQTVMFRHHFNLGHPLVDDGTVLAGDFTYWGARGERTPRRRPTRQFPRSLVLAARPQDEEVDYYRPMTPGVNALRVTGQDGPMLEFGIDGEQWPWLIV